MKTSIPFSTGFALVGCALFLTGAGLQAATTIDAINAHAHGANVRPPHSPVPVRVLTDSGAAGAKAISCYEVGQARD